jgi:4-hydroxy-3-methylbut-2-enyl diphosphate reductase
VRVILSNSYGFCYGVKRAIELAESNPNAVIIGGAIIQNPSELERLEKDFGITVQPDPSLIKPHQTAIIRSHGIAEQIELDLRARGVNIIDATCPSVKKIHSTVKQLDADGYTIILLGTPNHPETMGIVGYAKNPVLVVKTPSDIQNHIPNLANKKLALISQTTKNESDLLEIHRMLPSAQLFNTICTATKKNQQATTELAKTVDILIVVGGKHSANSNLLVTFAKNHCPAYLVEDPSQLDPSWFVGFETCGLTSGTSAPDYMLQAVKSAIETL